VAGLSSFLALVVGVTLWVVLSDDPYVAPRPGAASSQAEPAGAAATLQELTRAIQAGRPQDADALAAEDDQATAELLAALVDNADSIPLEDVTFRYVDEIDAAESTGEWSATVAATWRLSGLGERSAATDVRVDFATVEDRVVITGIGGRGARTPVWMTGPLEVRRDGDIVVMAARGADRYSTLARRAVGVVRRVLPAWDGRLVVEVPARAAGVDAALDVERGTFSNVAGVTAAADGSDGATAPVHVFLNPAQMRRLRPAGAQVVVSHEVVHVALDAPASSVPTWLSEGFADYVALRDVDLPLSTTAAQVIAQVRKRGAPQALPDDGDFDEQSDGFGAAYEAAWLACQLLAQQEGEETLLRLYRRAERSADFQRVFRITTNADIATFTRDWQALLRDLAR
jgi:hypothetical protein